MQEEAQQPVADMLVEALQQVGANGHYALEVLYLERYCSYYTVQLHLVLLQLLGVLRLEVTTGSIQVFTVLVVRLRV